MTGPFRTIQVVGWVGEVAITMRRYSDPPAHFHASSGGRNALISIEHLSILEGELPQGILDNVRSWARGRTGKRFASTGARPLGASRSTESTKAAEDGRGFQGRTD